MTEKIQSIPARIKNIAKGGHVAGTEDIIDDVSGKTQKEINTETGNKVDALQKQDIEAVTSLPAVGSADPKKIYRVAGETSYTDYMLNAAGTQFVAIATYSFPGIDDEPTAGSDNFVKSRGVYKNIALDEHSYLSNICKGSTVMKSNGAFMTIGNARCYSYISVDGWEKVQYTTRHDDSQPDVVLKPNRNNADNAIGSVSVPSTGGERLWVTNTINLADFPGTKYIVLNSFADKTAGVSNESIVLYNENTTGHKVALLDKEAERISKNVEEIQSVITSNKTVITVKNETELSALTGQTNLYVIIGQDIKVTNNITFPANSVIDFGRYHIGLYGNKDIYSPCLNLSDIDNAPLLKWDKNNKCAILNLGGDTSAMLNNYFRVDEYDYGDLGYYTTSDNFTDGWDDAEHLLFAPRHARDMQNVVANKYKIKRDYISNESYNYNYAYQCGIGNCSFVSNNGSVFSLPHIPFIIWGDVVIEGINFRNTSLVVINFLNKEKLNITFKNCKFENCSYISISAPEDYSIPYIHLNIQNCYSFKSTWHLIKTTGIVCDTIFVGDDRTDIIANTDWSSRGIHIISSENLVIKNNIFSNLVTGILFSIYVYKDYSNLYNLKTTKDGLKTRNIDICNNKFYNILEECISVDNASTATSSPTAKSLNSQKNICKVLSTEYVAYYSAGRKSIVPNGTQAKSKAVVSMLYNIPTIDDDIEEYANVGYVMYKLGGDNVGDTSYIKSIKNNGDNTYTIESETSGFFKNSENSIIAIWYAPTNVHIHNNYFENFGAPICFYCHQHHWVINNNIMYMKLASNYAYIDIRGGKFNNITRTGVKGTSYISFYNNVCDGISSPSVNDADMIIGSIQPYNSVTFPQEVQDLIDGGIINASDIDTVHVNNVSAIGNVVNTFIIANAKNVSVYGNTTKEMLEVTPNGREVINDCLTSRNIIKVVDDGVEKIWNGTEWVTSN